ISAFQQREQAVGGRRHAAGEQRAVFRALELGDFAFRGADGGVAIAAVLLALDPPLEVIPQLGGGLEGVGRAANNRGADRVVGLLALLAAPDGDGAKLAVRGGVPLQVRRHGGTAFPPTLKPVLRETRRASSFEEAHPGSQQLRVIFVSRVTQGGRKLRARSADLERRAYARMPRKLSNRRG